MIKSVGGSDCLKEAVQIRHDVVAVMTIDEAFAAVVDEPAVDVGAALRVASVVLLPASETQTESRGQTWSSRTSICWAQTDRGVPGDPQPAALHLHGGLLLQGVASFMDVVDAHLRLS